MSFYKKDQLPLFTEAFQKVAQEAATNEDAKAPERPREEVVRNVPINTWEDSREKILTTRDGYLQDNFNSMAATRVADTKLMKELFEKGPQNARAPSLRKEASAKEDLVTQALNFFTGRRLHVCCG